MALLVVQIDGPEGSGAPDRAAQVTAEATRLGFDLQPLHPGVTDPALTGWYAVEVGPEQAAAVLAALRALPSVVAAYEKPQDAAPEGPAG